MSTACTDRDRRSQTKVGFSFLVASIAALYDRPVPDASGALQAWTFVKTIARPHNRSQGSMTLALHRALLLSWDIVPTAPHSAPVPSVREQEPVPSTRATRGQRPRRRPVEERRPRPLIVLIVHAVLPTPSFYPNNHSLTRLLACPLKHLHTHRTHTVHTPVARPHTLPHTSAHARTSHISHHSSRILHLTSYILHLTSYIL